jgi:error-prone DNA polymerase
MVRGMTARGYAEDFAQACFRQIEGFGTYGFPESHAASFALLVYASAWMKCRYPDVFACALINSQPMGFWSPQSLLADAQRHGVVVHRPDVQVSKVETTLEGPRGGLGLRLGISHVRGLSAKSAHRVAEGAPWSSQEDLVRRADLTRSQLEALAASGALCSMGSTTRSLLWSAGAAAQATRDRLPGVVTGIHAPELDEPSAIEAVADDIWSMGLTPDATVMSLARSDLTHRGVLCAADLTACRASKVAVAGVVTHRQHPETAKGVVFVNLEDETGHINIVFSRGAWVRWRDVAHRSPGLVIWGRLERAQGVINVVAERVEELVLVGVTSSSRDYK